MAFDTCQVPIFVAEDPEDKDYLDAILSFNDAYDSDKSMSDAMTTGTGWSGAWFLIGLFQILFAISTLVLTLGSLYWYVRFCCSICSCILVGFNCCSAFIGLVTVVAPAGRLCSFNIAPVEYEGDGKWKADGATYADEYNSLVGVVAVAIILLAFQCCICVPCCLTPVKEKSDKKDKEVGDKDKTPKSDGHVPVDQSDVSKGNVTAGQPGVVNQME